MPIENTSLRASAAQVNKAESTIKDAKQPAVFNNLKSSARLDAVKENITSLAQSQTDQLGEEWVKKGNGSDGEESFGCWFRGCNDKTKGGSTGSTGSSEPTGEGCWFRGCNGKQK